MSSVESIEGTTTLLEDSSSTGNSETSLEDSSLMSSDDDSVNDESQVKDSNRNDPLFFIFLIVLIVIAVILSIVFAIFMYLYISERLSVSPPQLPKRLLSVSFSKCSDCKKCPKDCEGCGGKKKCMKANEEAIIIPGVKSTGFFSPPLGTHAKRWIESDRFKSVDEDFKDLQIIYDPSKTSFSALVGSKLKDLKDKVGEKYGGMKEKIIGKRFKFICHYFCESMHDEETKEGKFVIEARGIKLARVQCWVVALDKCLPMAPTNTIVTEKT